MFNVRPKVKVVFESCLGCFQIKYAWVKNGDDKTVADLFYHMPVIQNSPLPLAGAFWYNSLVPLMVGWLVLKPPSDSEHPDCPRGCWRSDSNPRRVWVVSTERKLFVGRVSAFLGMVLYMYPEKNGRHNRPHIHVIYGDDECVLSIPDGEVLAGEIPGRQLRNAQTFIDMRTEELMLNWNLCMEGKDVVWVDPIR